MLDRANSYLKKVLRALRSPIEAGTPVVVLEPSCLSVFRLEGEALVHGHCHHQALWKTADEEEVLRKLGLKFHLLDSGCCGMAGSFGFEEGEHYEVSQACGERVLLPAVRGAAARTLIVADGFSCREQISQGTGRRALHLAEVLQLALRERPYPPGVERRQERLPPLSRAPTVLEAILVGAGFLWAGALALRASRKTASR
jgi:Fe-S oxidoreductase